MLMIARSIKPVLAATTGVEFALRRYSSIVGLSASGARYLASINTILRVCVYSGISSLPPYVICTLLSYSGISLLVSSISYTFDRFTCQVLRCSCGTSNIASRLSSSTVGSPSHMYAALPSPMNCTILPSTLALSIITAYLTFLHRAAMLLIFMVYISSLFC